VELSQEVAVIGAGTMGAEITRVLAEAGSGIRLSASRESSLEEAGARRCENLSGVVGWRLSW
jgi:3-hydroxyacyl-CoA dehydrogenase